MSLIPPMLTARPQNNALYASSGSTAGVTQVVAGDASITVSPAGGTGVVTLTVPAGPATFATGMIMMYSTLAAPPVAPTGWAICDGTGGTPDLRDRFIVGAGLSYAVTQTGGAASTVIALNMIPDHTHGSGELSATSGNAGGGGFSFAAAGTTTGINSAGYGGGGDPLPTLPPYYALFYIIKT